MILDDMHFEALPNLGPDWVIEDHSECILGASAVPGQFCVAMATSS